jgi:hypothetical protein
VVICVPVYIFLHLSQKIIVQHDLISVFVVHFQCCCVLMWFSLKWISSNTRWKLIFFWFLKFLILHNDVNDWLECGKTQESEWERVEWKFTMEINYDWEKSSTMYVDGGGSWQSNCQLSKNLLDFSLREKKDDCIMNYFWAIRMLLV